MVQLHGGPVALCEKYHISRRSLYNYAHNITVPIPVLAQLMRQLFTEVGVDIPSEIKE
jgi:hypothetical protein